jgi:hypothetical protein
MSDEHFLQTNGFKKVDDNKYIYNYTKDYH